MKETPIIAPSLFIETKHADLYRIINHTAAINHGTNDIQYEGCFDQGAIKCNAISLSHKDKELIEEMEYNQMEIYKAFGVPKKLMPTKPKFRMVRKILRDKRFSRPVVFYQKQYEDRYFWNIKRTSR